MIGEGFEILEGDVESEVSRGGAEDFGIVALADDFGTGTAVDPDEFEEGLHGLGLGGLSIGLAKEGIPGIHEEHDGATGDGAEGVRADC